MKTEEFLVDGIGKLSYRSGIFRLEFMTLDSIPEPGATASYVCSHRIAMSLDTLVKLHKSLGRVLEELDEKGVPKTEVDQFCETGSWER